MVNRIAQSVTKLGWLNASLYLIGRLLSRISRDRFAIYKYYFVAQAIGFSKLCGGRGKNIDVRQFRIFDELPSTYPRPPEILRQRYIQGALSLAAFDDGKLIGFLWLSFRSYIEDEVRAHYTLGEAQAWDFDVWVTPETRVGLTFCRLWDEANFLLKSRDVQWSCSRISAFNSASIRAHTRMGTIKVGSATFFRCGNWQWTCSTLAPYFHISRHPASFPNFSFNTNGLNQTHSLEGPCSTLTK
jgi:hypothetical protein